MATLVDQGEYTDSWKLRLNEQNKNCYWLTSIYTVLILSFPSTRHRYNETPAANNGMIDR